MEKEEKTGEMKNNYKEKIDNCSRGEEKKSEDYTKRKREN